MHDKTYLKRVVTPTEFIYFFNLTLIKLFVRNFFFVFLVNRIVFLVLFVTTGTVRQF